MVSIIETVLKYAPPAKMGIKNPKFIEFLKQQRERVTKVFKETTGKEPVWKEVKPPVEGATQATSPVIKTIYPEKEQQT